MMTRITAYDNLTKSPKQFLPSVGLPVSASVDGMSEHINVRVRPFIYNTLTHCSGYKMECSG